MVDNHSQSFFGQSTGITIQSALKSDPYIFLKCIKKKEDGTWEKPSRGEGKTIKLSLDEMVMVLEVLKQKVDSWSSYHKYKKQETPISFKWEKNKEKKLWINIGNYSKILARPQIEIFRLLMQHLMKEKIEYSTVSNISNIQDKNANDETENIKTKYDKNARKNNTKNNINNRKQKIKIVGSIKAETEKALLLNLKSGHEIWVPRSIIHSTYDSQNNNDQTFITDKWILERNKISV